MFASPSTTSDCTYVAAFWNVYQIPDRRLTWLLVWRYPWQSTCSTLVVQWSVQSSPWWNTNIRLNRWFGTWRSEKYERRWAILVHCRWCDLSHANSCCWCTSGKPHRHPDLQDQNCPWPFWLNHFKSCRRHWAIKIIPFLVAHLMKFLNLDSLPQIHHNCDNQDQIIKVKSMLPTKQAWWWYDVTDSDLICETLHWGQSIQWTPWWEQGHPEWRIPDRSKWSNSEWGNHFADSLAGEVWNSNPMNYQSNPCAPIMPHAQFLQVQLPDGTISGKIKQNLPRIINTEVGLDNWRNTFITPRNRWISLIGPIITSLPSHSHLQHYPEPMHAKASTTNGILMPKHINTTII